MTIHSDTSLHSIKPSWLQRAIEARHAWRVIFASVPGLWLTIFFLLPLFVVLKISISEEAYAIPPYLPLVNWENGRLVVTLSYEAYGYILGDPRYVGAYFSSLRIAAISTILTLLIGYPMAYFIARSNEKLRNFWLLLIVLPFWTSFLLRVYAWIGILKDNGLVNNMLMSIGIIDAPMQILYTDVAVYIGMVYTYLPFMVLPLYANLTKIDVAYEEAASDLGANSVITFFTIILPLSRSGMIAGSMLVFIPAVGEFVIPALLGGPDTLMIGKVLWDEYFLNRSWPTASAVAMVMLMVIVLPILFTRKHMERAAQ